MKNITGFQVPGTESYGYSGPGEHACLSREFVREVAQLLEAGLEETTHADRYGSTKALPLPDLPAEPSPQGTVWEYEDA